MKNRKVLRSLLLAAAIVLALLWTSGAMAIVPSEEGTQDPNQLFSSEPISPAEAQAAIDYWTAERMREAIPYPVPTLSAETLAETKMRWETAPAAAAGPPVVIPGGFGALATKSDQEALLLEETEELEDWGAYAQLPEQAGGTEPLGYAYPPPFSRYNTFPNYKFYPYRTIGRVFFTSGGTNYSCSGSVAVGRAVWTAGHCVHSGGPGGAWHTNWVFVPAYKSGLAPYGTWSAFNLTSLTGWTGSSLFCYDQGMAAVSDKGGLTIGQTVGWLGFMADANRIQHWHNFGYPAGAPFTGKYMVISAGSHARNDTPSPCGAGDPQTIAMGSDQTGGCSGGPWIVKFKGAAGATNYVNGLNSYKYVVPNEPRQIYAAYFSTGAINLYNWGAVQ